MNTSTDRKRGAWHDDPEGTGKKGNVAALVRNETSSDALICSSYGAR